MASVPVAGQPFTTDRLPIHRRGFRYVDLAIGVASPEPSHLVWLEEFLAPAFEPIAPDGCDRWVVLDTDATRHAAMLARGPSPASPPVACFVLDDRTVRHPEWTGTGPDERILFDTDYQTFYQFARASGHVRILAAHGRNPVRSALMRVVRELAMAASIARGGLFVHGAAFAIDARGVVLAGPKHAGKTTLLLLALQAAGAAFIANDRVLVRRDQGRLLLRGMPTIVRLRPQTLATFPAVAARIRRRAYHHTRTLAESGLPAQQVAPRRDDGLARLTAAQLCDAAGVTPLPEAEAWRLVFPRVTDSVTGIRVEPLDARTAAQRLRAAWFGAEELPGRMSEAFSGPTGATALDEAALERRAVELTAWVSCYDAELGAGAYEGTQTAEAFLAQLTASTSVLARHRA